MYKKGMVGEYQKHHGTIAMLPFRKDIWRNDAIEMQKYIINLTHIISRYEKVYLFCHPDINLDKIMLPKDILIIRSLYDDIWARDICPTFIRNDKTIECIDWKFNSWGGEKEGAYIPWDKDDAFPSIISEFLNLKRKRVDIVLEGGSIVTDGNGTIFTTRSVLLNRNRNPFKSKDYIEKKILDATFDKRIVWLDQGLADDETNGHIDNILSFVNQNELCLAFTEDKNNPNYERLKRAYNILHNISDLNGIKYKINLIPLPPTQYMVKDEEKGLNHSATSIHRKAGDILPASYLNYYMINGAVLIPSFGCDLDDKVKKIFEKIFYDREVIQIYSREPLLGGGGIHCIVHEIPELEITK